MARLVLKFGGTSVGDIARIKNVANKIKKEWDQGHEVAVVVSAMSGETNKLVAWTDQVSDNLKIADAREYDTVVASGEVVTCGLVALALQNIGVPARSWQGWQVPILTTGVHGSARIESIDGSEVIKRLSGPERQVAVFAGFQGLGPNNRVTTLGRGGSDTSAVALAAALRADRCDIYTDVTGVFTCDPRIVERARKLDKITYEEMLEMASLGAKVLHTRSVEIAMNHKVRVQVLSSFEDVPGTMVVDEEEIMEQQMVSGIAYSRDEAKVTLARVPDRPGIAASIFGPLASANVNVDMIVQNISDDGKATDLTFTVSRRELDQALHVLESQKDTIGFSKLVSDKDVVKVSIIGVGMRSHVGVASKMFSTLAENGINIEVITTSEIKVSVLIKEKYTELALRALHSAYDLDG